jgi:hypothetical protein
MEKKKDFSSQIFSCLGILVLQHLARVTNHLDIGAEFLYQANPMMPGGHVGITSFVSRYRGKNTFQRKYPSKALFFLGLDWFTGIKLSPAGAINLGYFHHKMDSPLKLGVEFESSIAVKETCATFSYQYDLLKANTTLRGKGFLINLLLSSYFFRYDRYEWFSYRCY